MPRSLFPLFLLLSFFLCWGGAASAQPIIDPGFLEFTASADHAAVDGSGQPKVSRYDFLLYIVGSPTPARVVSIGKPAPDSNGTIRIALGTILNPLPAGGTIYEARIAAVGANGSAASQPSNPFSFQVPCGYSIAPTSQLLGSASSTSTFSVTATPGCAWTATTSTTWITITGGATGIGDGTVTFAVANNLSTSSRNGLVTIAGQPASVSQAGIACTYAVSPISQSVPRTGGSVTFAVTSPPGCSWSASEQSSWISIASGATGTGNGNVTFSVAANTATQARSASATVAGQTVTLSQPVSTPPNAPTGMRIVS